VSQQSKHQTGSTLSDSSKTFDRPQREPVNLRTENSNNKPIGLLVIIPALYGLWLLTTSLTEVIPKLGIYNGKRILELYLIIVTLSAPLISTQARQKLGGLLLAIPVWVRIILMVFFGLGLSSALLTANPAYPLLDVAMLFLLMLTAFTVASTRQILGIHFDRVVLTCIAMMGLGILFQELLGMLVFLSADMQFNYRESLFHFFHPRLYNQVQTWTIPILALLPVAFGKSRRLGLLGIFLIGAQWYIILQSGARGTTISLILAMLIIGLALPSVRTFWLKVQVTGLILGILFYVSTAFFLGSVQPDKTEYVAESVGRPLLHTTGRTDLWKHAIEDAIQNPLLGAGPMRYACGANHYLAGSPHSFPLQIMGEWGIPAFVLLGILFGWMVYSWIHAAKSLINVNTYNQTLVACLSISCLAAIIHVCVSGLLIAPSSQVTGILITGWLLSSLFKDSDTKSSVSSRIKGAKALYMALLGIMVSVSVCWFAISELGELPYRTSYAQDFGPSAPRFWHDGRFCEYSF